MTTEHEIFGPAGLRRKDAVDLLVDTMHGASVQAGWWHDKNGTAILDNVYAVSNKLALIHSEVSEALEADRKSRPGAPKMDSHLPQHPAILTELVDVLIRTMDLAGALRYLSPETSFGEITMDKLRYNAQRQDHKVEVRETLGGKGY